MNSIQLTAEYEAQKSNSGFWSVSAVKLVAAGSQVLMC